MSEPFLAEIRMVGFNFAPRGWAFCDGQIMPINQNQSLYSLLGTTYGGDGRSSFALPELRGRTPIHQGDGHALGNKGGAQTVTLTKEQIAAHTHQARASSANGNNITATNNILAAAADGYRAYESGTNSAMKPNTLTNDGGGQSHDNMQPYLAINFCIALQGLFPSRN